MSVQVLVGDCREMLATLPDKSVHMCVTSPPYYGLRDYGVPGQIGLEPTPQEWITSMLEVFVEVWRVLRDDGTVWLNIGDSYAGSGKGPSGHNGIGNQEERQGFDAAPTRTQVPGYKPKDLMGIPWRLAFALQDAGWYLRADIIWSKPNPMPESVTDRPTKAHEYLFLLTKSGTSQFWVHRDGLPGSRTLPAPDYRWQDAANNNAETAVEPPDWRTEQYEGGLRWRRVNLWSGRDYYYDADAIREPATDGNTSRFKAQLSYGTTRSGLPVPGAPKPDSPYVISQGRRRGLPGVGTTFGSDDPASRNKRSVWTVATEAFPESHFATYPTALVEPCIKAGTSERGVCPECGAPWVRVVERGELVPDAPGYKPRGAQVSPHELVNIGTGKPNHHYESQTTGWRASCKHDAAPVPATVLDPFFGAGTTGLVADRLDRNCIGVELNPEYAEMARRRLTRDAPMFMDVAVS